MLVILLENVSNLGKLGDQVNVKSGYARNFLIPQNKAVQATKKNIEYFKLRRAELEANLERKRDIANSRIKKIHTIGNCITISSKAGETGKLFGSVSARDIANAINSTVDIEIDKSEVRLPNGTIRSIGTHEVTLRFGSDISSKLIVNVIAE